MSPRLPVRNRTRKRIRLPLPMRFADADPEPGGRPPGLGEPLGCVLLSTGAAALVVFQQRDRSGRLARKAQHRIPSAGIETKAERLELIQELADGSGPQQPGLLGVQQQSESSLDRDTERNGHTSRQSYRRGGPRASSIRGQAPGPGSRPAPDPSREELLPGSRPCEPRSIASSSSAGGSIPWRSQPRAPRRRQEGRSPVRPRTPRPEAGRADGGTGAARCSRKPHARRPSDLSSSSLSRNISMP
jgi:hypothetical protein